MGNKVGIIGHFGGGHEFLDGQTIKTKVLYEELKKCGHDNIFCVDTYYNYTNKAKLLWDSIKCILSCNTTILLLSGNGMRIYFPIMYYAKKVFRCRVFHNVIGGNLASYVDKYPKYKRYLNSFDGNWVEFGRMKVALEKRGITNCTVIPNFKRLNTEAAKLEINEETKHKLCMFSRVMKEKGMTEAIEAVHRFNEKNERKLLLEIWGPIDESYKAEFEVLLGKYKADVEYKGKVDYSKSVEKLTDHLALLFPTHWDGEGFPGTIVDAYAAALPIIASDWNANSELINNFETGWVYPNERVTSLDESLEWVTGHIDEMLEMRQKCRDKAKEFMPDIWIDKIVTLIEGKQCYDKVTFDDSYNNNHKQGRTAD